MAAHIRDLMPDRATAFLQYDQHQILPFKIGIVILVTGIQESDCAVGVDVLSPLQIVNVLACLVVGFQFCSGTDYGMVRIARFIRSAICSDVLGFKSVCFRFRGSSIWICFVANYGPAEFRKLFHDLLWDIGLCAVFQLHTPVCSGPARIGFRNPIMEDQNLIAAPQAREQTFLILSVAHDNG